MNLDSLLDDANELVGSHSGGVEAAPKSHKKQKIIDFIVVYLDAE